MKKSFALTAVSLAAASFMMIAGQAQAVVPPVDPKGVAADSQCGTLPGTPPGQVRHFDKIIFSIVPNVLGGTLVAANPADQRRLSSVPRNTELDIKVVDNPKTVADLKAKVLSFLGAAVTAANRQQIRIIDVDYAVICSTPQITPVGG